MMTHDTAIEARLHERLRQPASSSTVQGCLPALFFGELLLAKVATVSLNPSRQEYTARNGEELVGLERRFETLQSLHAGSRAELTPQQCNRVISTMRGYFDPERPAYSWFNSMARVVEGMSFHYWKREVVHLDLVQEATNPTWSALLNERPEEGRALLKNDAPFLRWQLETFPLRAVLCNGRTTFDRVVDLFGAEVICSDKLARLTWSIAVAEVGGRRLAIAGWNIPLARPTGLTADGQRELGQMLRSELERLGIGVPA